MLQSHQLHLEYLGKKYFDLIYVKYMSFNKLRIIYKYLKTIIKNTMSQCLRNDYCYYCTF